MHHLPLQVLPQLRVHIKLILQSWILRIQIFSQHLQIWDHKILLLNLSLKETPIQQLRLALEKEGLQKVQLRRLRQKLINHKTKSNIPNLRQIAKHKLQHQRKVKISCIVNQQFLKH
jgi:hypothetical protein